MTGKSGQGSFFSALEPQTLVPLEPPYVPPKVRAFVDELMAGGVTFTTGIRSSTMTAEESAARKAQLASDIAAGVVEVVELGASEADADFAAIVLPSTPYKRTPRTKRERDAAEYAEEYPESPPVWRVVFGSPIKRWPGDKWTQWINGDWMTHVRADSEEEAFAKAKAQRDVAEWGSLQAMILDYGTERRWYRKGSVL